MSQHQIDLVVGDETVPFATIPVRIITVTDHAELARGFYFAFPPAPGDEVGPGEVFIHGPFKDAQEALREAGTFITEAATAHAREVLANNEELAA